MTSLVSQSTPILFKVYVVIILYLPIMKEMNVTFKITKPTT